MRVKTTAIAVVWAGLLCVWCSNVHAIVYSEAGNTTVPLWVQAPGLPRQAVPLADVGLQAGDDIDAVSLGFDPLPDETDPLGQRLDVFAAAPGTLGQPGSALAARATIPGINVERDIYRESPTQNEVLIPELIPDGAIDAFDGGLLGPAGGQWIFFSLTASSPTLTANGWSAGDVLMVRHQVPGSLGLYAAANTIGEPVDIDGLSIKDATPDGSPYAPADDMMIYSTDGAGGNIYHYGAGAPGDNHAHDHHSFGMKMYEDIEALAHIFFRELEQRLPLVGLGDEYGSVCHTLSHASPPDAPVQAAYYYCASRDASPDPVDQSGKHGAQGDVAVPGRGFDRFVAALTAQGKTLADVKLRWTPGDLNGDVRGTLADWGQGDVADWWYNETTKIELRQYEGAVGSLWVDGIKLAEYPEISMWMHIDYAAVFTQTGDPTIFGWGDPRLPAAPEGLQSPYAELADAFIADHAGKPSRIYLDSMENPTQAEFGSGNQVGSYFGVRSGFVQILEGTSSGDAQVWIDQAEGVVLNAGMDVWPGQSVAVEIPLRNDGTEDAENAVVTLFPQLPLGTGGAVLDGTAHYGNIAAGSAGIDAQVGDALALQLGGDYPGGTDLPVTVVIEYGDGRFAMDGFTIHVRGLSISGAVTYTGRQHGPLTVQALHEGQVVASTAATVAGRTTAYQFDGLVPVSYDIRAFVDADRNGLPTYPEAEGGTAQPVLLTDADATNVDILVEDYHSDADGLPDWWEALYGYDKDLVDSDTDGTNDQAEDPDGDGDDNATEYANGTNPLLSETVFGWRLYDDFEEAAVDPVRWTAAQSGGGLAPEIVDGALALTAHDVDGAQTAISDVSMTLPGASGFRAWMSLDEFLPNGERNNPQGTMRLFAGIGGGLEAEFRIQTSSQTAPPLRSERSTRVVGGQEATPDAWPWIAAIAYAGTANGYNAQFCGGSLIAPGWVLTAAHCVDGMNAGDVEVILGRHTLSANDGERLTVARIIVHEAYDDKTYDNDIALLELGSNSGQEPIALVFPEDYEAFEPGVLATVAGWGLRIAGDNGSAPDELHDVQVPIVSNDVANAPNAYDGEITNNMLAAGLAEGGKDSCQGDSGGPFMVPDTDGEGWVQAGIVSWGDGCADPNKYGIYTRVANYVGWVEGHTGALLEPTAEISAAVIDSTTGIPVETMAQPLSAWIGRSTQLGVLVSEGSVSFMVGDTEVWEYAPAVERNGFTLGAMGLEATANGGRVEAESGMVETYGVMPAPENDNFADAIMLGTDSGHLHALTLAASKETGEPNHAGDLGGRSVWYEWTPSVEGLAAWGTFENSFDTVLAVYVGDDVGALTPVASNDNAPSGANGESQLAFRTQPQTTYLVAVDGASGSQGEFGLEWTLMLPPPNDLFQNATPLVGMAGSVDGTNAAASEETGEATHAAGGSGISVWWTWTPDSSGAVGFDTIGSSFDTVLAVYTGSAVDTLTEVAANDNDEDGAQVTSALGFDAVSGTTYYIAVDGVEGHQGDVELTWGQIPANDDVTGAADLAGNTGSTAGTNVGATLENGEGQHGGKPGGRSVWWTWTPTEDGAAIVTTFNSDFDTILAVYTGNSVADFVEVASNDDAPCGSECGSEVASGVTFAVQTNATYHIVVDGYDGESGSITLNWDLQLPSQNDDFSAAAELAGTDGQVTGSNLTATVETGEPDHAGETGGASLWWEWTAGSDAPVVFDTVGSTLDTLLAVYTGGDVAALTEVVSNDEDATDDGTSELVLLPQAGTTYYIAVDGYLGVKGAVTLNWETVAGLAANDDFADAIAIANIPFSTVSSNWPATAEAGEPYHADRNTSTSVWWRWTPSATEDVFADTEGSDFDTILAVYTGTSVDALTPVAANDDSGAGDRTSRAAFTAQAGTTYHIVVDGFAGRMGDIALQLGLPPAAPTNDNFANATLFSPFPGQMIGSTISATAETGETGHAGNAGGASLWWTLSVIEDVALVVDTHGSGFDTLLAVYTGSSVDALSQVAANDDDNGEPGNSGLAFDGTAGTTYYIVVDGYDGIAGSYVLNVGPQAPTDSDQDGLPDAYETATFGDLAQDGAGDFDGDGDSNLAEYNNNTDPTDAGSAQTPFENYHFKLYRGGDQTSTSRGATTNMWGAEFFCWPPAGMVFASGTLTKPATAVGTNPADLGIWDDGDEAEWEREDYGDLDTLQANMVSGEYRVDLVMVPSTPGRGDSRTTQHLRFTIDLAEYDIDDFPPFLVILSPAQGETGVSTEPQVELGTAAWDTLSIEKYAVDEDGYFVVQQGTPSAIHQVPPDAALLPDTAYNLDVGSHDPTTHLGTQTFVTFTTAATTPEFLRLELTGASVGALEFGENPEATSGPDPGLDRVMPPPPQNTGEAVFLAPEGSVELRRLQRDIRREILGSRWQIEATAAATTDLVITWNPATMPTDPPLMIWRLTEEGGTVVPDSLASMSDASIVTVPAGERHYYAIGSAVAFEIQTDPVTVPEGNTADVFVRLTVPPSAPVLADLSWSSGDLDLGVAVLRGASLSFDAGNWDQWQAVSLAAAEDDDDGDAGVAEFTVSQTGGSDTLEDVLFSAEEQDDDVVVTVVVDGSGTTDPEGTVWVDMNDTISLDIEATPDLNWEFVNWTLDSPGAATLGNPAAQVTAVTPTGDVTVTAHLVASLVVGSQTPASPATVQESTPQDFVVTPNGGTGPYTYEWRLDGDLLGGETTDTYSFAPDHDAVVHPADSDTGTLVCTVTDSTGQRLSVDATWDITIEDVDRQAPAPLVSVTPGVPMTTDDLTAAAIEQGDDPDGDEIIGYHYEWTLVDLRGARSTDTLASAETAKGDVWQVSVSAKTKPYGDNGPEIASPNTGTAQVTIENTVPVAVPLRDLTVQAGQALLVQLEGSDPDADDGVDSLTFAITAQPANGSLTDLDPVAGTVTYESAAEFSGPDSFTFSVDDDGELPVQEADVSVFVYSDWLVTLDAQGATPETLRFGVTDGATTAFDSTFDVPAGGGDTVAFLRDGVPQRRDMVGPPDTPVWELEVTGLDDPVLLTWDPGAIPEPGLALCELDEPGGTCLPGTIVDMLDTSELLIEATRNATTRVFRIEAVEVVELTLQSGWNLVSLPVAPFDPAVEVVFGEGSVTPNRNGRTAVYTDAVYSWDTVEKQYESVTAMEPLVGYWVYLEAPEDLAIRGLSVAGTPIPLAAGWNLVGVAGTITLTENELIYFPAWAWNAVDQVYEALHVGDMADPGIAFWVFSAGETELSGK